MMLKIDLILKQREIFNKLVDERFKWITELKNKVRPDDLIYRYIGPTADAKFNEFDNAFSLVHKVKRSEINLGYVKKWTKKI